MQARCRAGLPAVTVSSAASQTFSRLAGGASHPPRRAAG
jgi:hypothetical protein